MRVAVLAFGLFAASASAKPAEPEQLYVVTITDLAKHQMHVQFRSSSKVATARFELSPVACGTRAVNSVKATDANGKEMPVAAQRETKWLVSGHGFVDFEYDVTVDATCLAGVSTSAREAFLNLENVLVYRSFAEGVPTVQVTGVPAAWKLYTTLPNLQTVGDHGALFEVRAQDFNHLTDSPLATCAEGKQFFISDWKLLVATCEGFDLAELVRAVREALPKDGFDGLNAMLLFRRGTAAAVQTHRAALVISLPERPLQREELAGMLKAPLALLACDEQPCGKVAH